MSLFGKILAVFNVLAAVAFFYVASIDWAKHEAWADAALQHDLLIQGLPVDDKEPDAQGNSRVENLRESALRQMLKSTPVVKTQVAEVNRVHDLIQNKINAQDNEQARVALLAKVLLPLATTESERDLRRRQIADPAGSKASTSELQEQVDDAFNKAAGPKFTVQTAEGPSSQRDREYDEKRQAIAHLLFSMDDVLREDENPQQPPDLLDSKAYERTLAVVGLPAMAREADNQSAILGRMSRDVLAGIDRDRTAFVAAQHRQLALIEALSEQLDRQVGYLTDQAEQVRKEAVLVNQRKMEKTELENDLANVMTDIRARLKEQQTMEKALFKSRQELRDAYAENQKLEQTIRSLEENHSTGQ